MTTPVGGRLGVDFGTTSTVAVLDLPDGIATPLLFDASPLLGSGVFAGPGGELLTGADAYRAAAAHPGGFEPHPKRRVDDGTVWLGERELTVTDLVAAVLERVRREVHRVGGGAPRSVVLTHPAVWGPTRRDLLRSAARRAGFDAVSLVAEPVAAAAYFTTTLGRDLAAGHALAVYDLGAGTFDISMVRRDDDGFQVLAAGGLDDLGGIDLDQLVVEHARLLTAESSAEWGRLDWPESTDDRRARRMLWEGARGVKEQLSRHAAAELHVPLVGATVRVTRDEFERAARPLLQRSVDLTLTTLRQAGVTRATLAGLFLVGGSSRVPLVATLLHRTLGSAPTVIDQPELAVAAGSLHVDRPQPRETRAIDPPPRPQPRETRAIDPPPRPSPAGAEPREQPAPHGPPPATRRLNPASTAAAAALVALMPVDMALGGYILMIDSPVAMARLLGVQIGAALAWSWVRTRWIRRPGWGHVVATVFTTVAAGVAVLLLFRDMGASTLPAAAVTTTAIAVSVGALLPARRAT